MPQGSECPSSDHQCDVSRLPAGSEYRIDVAGPSAMAIHVVAARDAAAGAHQSLTGDGYRGVVVPRASGAVVVVTNAASDGALASKLAYAAPSNAVHVVVDAPVDSAGKSDVTATTDGSSCRVSVTPHQGSATGYDGRPLIVRLDAACNVTDDGTQTMPVMGNGGAMGTGGTTSNGMGGTSAGPTVNGTAGEGGSSDSPGSTNQGGAPETMSTHGPSSGGMGTSGANAATGGASGLGNPNGVGGSAGMAANGSSVPPVPVLSSGCSVSSGATEGPAAAFVSAFIGLLLLARTRRRAGFAPR
jgi:hypothetical protein